MNILVAWYFEHKHQRADLDCGFVCVCGRRSDGAFRLVLDLEACETLTIYIYNDYFLTQYNKKKYETLLLLLRRDLGGILLLKAVIRQQHAGFYFRRFTGWWCQIFHEYNLKGLEFVATLVPRVPRSTQVLTEGKAQFFVLLGPQAAHEFTPSNVGYRPETSSGCIRVSRY